MDVVEVKGARIPAIGLGTWQVEGADCYDAVAHALALGYRHIDTAQAYGNEEQCGRALADAAVPRDEVWVTTKVWRDRAAADRVGPSTEESLRRLRTDHVDLMLVHWPVDDVPVAETLGALAELREQGKARFVGVSNYPAAWVREAVATTEIVTNQVEYHPFLSQDALLAEAERDGHALTAYSPVAQGKVADDPTIAEIAEAHGKTAAQVALRWLIQQPRVLAIPRSTSERRREENLDVFDFALSDDDVKRISDLGSPEGRLIDPPFAPAWDA